MQRLREGIVAMSWKEQFEIILRNLVEKSIEFYGDRLISVVVFGSVGRGAMRPDSDIDVLYIVDPLPAGRLRRVEEFDELERRMDSAMSAARDCGVHTALSPVFKTPAEARRGSPLFLDMIEDARILFDRAAFFRTVMDSLRLRLSRLGAKRVWKGNAWYWDLKPDYSWGEEFEI